MMYNFFLFIIIMCTWSLVEQTTRWFVATEQIFLERNIIMMMTTAKIPSERKNDTNIFTVKQIH